MDNTTDRARELREQAQAEYYAEHPEHLNLTDDGHAAAILRRAKREAGRTDPYLKRETTKKD